MFMWVSFGNSKLIIMNFEYHNRGINHGYTIKAYLKKWSPMNIFKNYHCKSRKRKRPCVMYYFVTHCSHVYLHEQYSPRRNCLFEHVWRYGHWDQQQRSKPGHADGSSLLCHHSSSSPIHHCFSCTCWCLGCCILQPLCCTPTNRQWSHPKQIRQPIRVHQERILYPICQQ